MKLWVASSKLQVARTPAIIQKTCWFITDADSRLPITKKLIL